MCDIVEQPGLSWANSCGSVPEWWGDNDGAGSLFTDDDRPCLVGVLVIDADLEMPDEPHPEIGLESVSMPCLDDAGVLDREVDLTFGTHDALELIHQRPAAIICEMARRNKDRSALGLGDVVCLGQWDAHILWLFDIHRVPSAGCV